MSADLLAGVDVGGSKIAVLVTDRSLTPVARLTVRTGVGEPQAAVDQVATAVASALRAAGRRSDELAGLGIGVPGRVDSEAGVVTMAVNLGWHEVALGPGLERHFGVPVAVENDVKAAAAGLASRGRTGGLQDLAYLGIGTGISAGIVIDGGLYRGARGLAGEIGHVVLEADGPRCECGLRGCLEAMASGRGIASLADASVAAGRLSLRAVDDPRTADARAVTAIDVFAAAGRGDPEATAIIEAAGRAIARAVHLLVMTYDLQAVFLGGGVTAAGPQFRDPVERGLDVLRASSPLAREVLGPGVLHVLAPDAEAGAWGAIVLAARAASLAAPLPSLHETTPAGPVDLASAEARSP